MSLSDRTHEADFISTDCLEMSILDSVIYKKDIPKLSDFTSTGFLAISLLDKAHEAHFASTDYSWMSLLYSVLSKMDIPKQYDFACTGLLGMSLLDKHVRLASHLQTLQGCCS